MEIGQADDAALQFVDHDDRGVLALSWRRSTALPCRLEAPIVSASIGEHLERKRRCL